MSENRINLMLSKIGELLNQKGERNPLDAELMIDYTKIIYADLLELRKEWSALDYLTQYDKKTTAISIEWPKDVKEQTIETESVNTYIDADDINEKDEIKKIDETDEEKKSLKTISDESKGIETEIEDSQIKNTSTEISTKSDFSFDTKPEEAIISKIQRIENNHKPLESYIGMNDRFMLIADLFNNDTEAYKYFILNVSKNKSFVDASAFINQTYEWNKDSKAYGLIEEILKSYFNNYK